MPANMPDIYLSALCIQDNDSVNTVLAKELPSVLSVLKWLLCKNLTLKAATLYTNYFISFS